MRTMKVSEARKSFARALAHVVNNDEPLVIVRYRRPIAAIVPIERVDAPERTGTRLEQRPDGRRRRR
jgi:PHD/YefM family antitoxin component YafN of YafNO toxin-antitoxin module